MSGYKLAGTPARETEVKLGMRGRHSDLFQQRCPSETGSYLPHWQHLVEKEGGMSWIFFVCPSSSTLCVSVYFTDGWLDGWMGGSK